MKNGRAFARPLDRSVGGLLDQLLGMFLIWRLLLVLMRRSLLLHSLLLLFMFLLHLLRLLLVPLLHLLLS